MATTIMIGEQKYSVTFETSHRIPMVYAVYPNRLGEKHYQIFGEAADDVLAAIEAAEWQEHLDEQQSLDDFLSGTGRM